MKKTIEKVEETAVRIATDDPYENVADFIKCWIEEHSYLQYEDYLVWVWTENLGYDVLYLEYDGTNDRFTWLFDWYEGGECRLIGFCPVRAIPLAEEWRCENMKWGEQHDE